MKNEINNRDPYTTSDSQPIEAITLDAKIQNGQFDKAVRIHIHSIRKRLTDTGGVSDKALIDGIVEAAVLSDDSAKEIESITNTQEVGKEEKTIITIET